MTPLHPKSPVQFPAADVGFPVEAGTDWSLNPRGRGFLRKQCNGSDLQRDIWHGFHQLLLHVPCVDDDQDAHSTTLAAFDAKFLSELVQSSAGSNYSFRTHSPACVAWTSSVPISAFEFITGARGHFGHHSGHGVSCMFREATTFEHCERLRHHLPP